MFLLFLLVCSLSGLQAIQAACPPAQLGVEEGNPQHPQKRKPSPSLGSTGCPQGWPGTRVESKAPQVEGPGWTADYGPA